jgi:hypothetical protein
MPTKPWESIAKEADGRHKQTREESNRKRNALSLQSAERIATIKDQITTEKSRIIMQLHSYKMSGTLPPRCARQ